MQSIFGDPIKITFTSFKLGGHTLISWEDHSDSLTHENIHFISSCEDFNNVFKDKLYPLGYHKKQMMK